MSKATKLIVAGYVRLNDRKQLAAYLKGTNGRLDHGATIQQVEEEIAIIDTGIKRLDSAT